MSETIIFPQCPICKTGTHRAKTSRRGNLYYQCDDCGSYGGSRFLTAEERARAKADKAARKAKKTKPKVKKRSTLDEQQLPAEGFDFAEWGPEWAEGAGECHQMKLFRD